MKTIKKTIYVVAILVAAVAVTGILGFSHTTSAEKFEKYDIDYHLSLPVNDVVMKPGDTKVIPVSVHYPQEKSLHIRTGVTTPNNESAFIATGIANLPTGISAELDQKTVDLPAMTSKGDTIRDTTNLKISVSQDVQPGKYPIAVVVFEDNGAGYSRFLTIEVQK